MAIEQKVIHNIDRNRKSKSQNPAKEKKSSKRVDSIQQSSQG